MSAENIFWERMKSLGQKNALPQVQLFESPDEGLGRDWARKATQLIFCQSKTLCGHCDPCLKPSSDLLVIDPPGHSIKVTDILPVLDHLTFFSVQGGGARIVVIHNVERLNSSSFHRLLKILEEPYPHNFLLLTTVKSVLLPKTLLSRCVKWYLPSKVLPKKKEYESFYQDLMQPNSSLAMMQVAEALSKNHQLSVRDFLCVVEEFCNRFYKECLLKQKPLPSKDLILRRRAWMRKIRTLCVKEKVPLSGQLVMEGFGLLGKE
jgi:hypothetical protein